MAESERDMASAMLANALVANLGSRRLAAEEAARRTDRQATAQGRSIWRKAHDYLRSASPIPPYRRPFDSIPNPHSIRYERVQCFASGGAVGHADGDKASKKTANYSPYGSQEQHCSICRMFRDPNKCTAVEGSISRTAICDYFEHDDGKVRYERVPIKHGGQDAG